MEEKKRPITKWIYWFTLISALIIVYKLLDNFNEIGIWISNLFEILMPFIVGILIAYLLYIPCKSVEKVFKKLNTKNILHKKAISLSVFIVYIITVLIIIGALNYLVPVIVTSVEDLVANIQNYYNITLDNYENLPEDSVLKTDILNVVIESLEDIDIKSYFNISMIADYAMGALNIATKVFEFFVAIIVSIYILLQRDRIQRFFERLGKAVLDNNVYKNIETTYYRMNDVFFKFLAGQFIDGIVVGIITSIAMSLMGVKYAVLLGFMIGLFNLIPYFGAIIAVILATLITILTGGLSQAITMVIVVTILQQIDANIINPKIIGNSLEISPLLVIFGVTIGGAYFGVWGMFLAVPVFTVIKLIIEDVISYKTPKEEYARIKEEI